MSKVIYKYHLYSSGSATILKGAEVLCVNVLGGEVFLWAIVDPNETEYENRQFIILATGQAIPEERGDYIGTFILPLEGLVFHLFNVV